jgi:hypothetical protein
MARAWVGRFTWYTSWMSRAEWNWGMNRASLFQNSVSSSGPSNSSKPREASLSFSCSRNST